MRPEVRGESDARAHGSAAAAQAPAPPRGRRPGDALRRGGDGGWRGVTPCPATA